MEKLKSFISKQLVDEYGDSMSTLAIEGDPDWEAAMKQSGVRGIASNAKSGIVKFVDGKNLFLFIKSCEVGSSAEYLNGVLGIFTKEMFFYKDILPQLVEFEKNNKDFNASEDSLQTLFLKCYGCTEIDRNIYIVLEKFSLDDYFVTKPEQFYTVPQILYCMKSIAQLHATSFCMKKKGQFKWEDHELLADTLFDQRAASICDQYMFPYLMKHLKVLRAMKEEIRKRNNLVKDCILSFQGLNMYAIERLEKLGKDLGKILRKTLECPKELRVLIHGDFHMWNVAFSSKGKMEGKFFDFQIIRYTSGIIDLHHFLSQVCTPATRNKHLFSFLQAYYNSFKQTCNSYGLKDEEIVYTIEKITEEYTLRSPWGFLFGFLFVLPRFVSKDFYVLLDDKHTSSEIIGLLADKGSENVWSVLEMYVDMLQIQEDLGTFDVMERLAHNIA